MRPKKTKSSLISTINIIDSFHLQENEIGYAKV